MGISRCFIPPPSGGGGQGGGGGGGDEWVRFDPTGAGVTLIDDSTQKVAAVGSMTVSDDGTDSTFQWITGQGTSSQRQWISTRLHTSKIYWVDTGKTWGELSSLAVYFKFAAVDNSSQLPTIGFVLSDQQAISGSTGYWSYCGFSGNPAGNKIKHRTMQCTAASNNATLAGTSSAKAVATLGEMRGLINFAAKRGSYTAPEKIEARNSTAFSINTSGAVPYLDTPITTSTYTESAVNGAEAGDTVYIGLVQSWGAANNITPAANTTKTIKLSAHYLLNTCTAGWRP